jgi:hypothetical protein
MSADDFDEEFTDYERRILANIDEYGCHITYVFDPDDGGPDFCYSAGFSHSLGQGEVIVFGLPKDLMQSMVNGIMRQCKDDGLVLRDSLRVANLLEGFDVVVRSIPAHRIEREHFNSAMWHHVGKFGGRLETAYQVVWPGSQQGLFPWEPGCHQDVIALQPTLYETSLNS